MAQLVARLAWDEEVAGSSPATLTIGEMPEWLNGARLKRDGPVGAPGFESLSLRQSNLLRSNTAKAKAHQTSRLSAAEVLLCALRSKEEIGLKPSPLGITSVIPVSPYFANNIFR